MVTRGDKLIAMCRVYAKKEGATCEGMIGRIEKFLAAQDADISGRLGTIRSELARAKEDIGLLRAIKLTQSGLLIAEKAVESIEKLGYAYTYTLEVAVYFRQKGFMVDRTEHKVSYIIREPEVDDNE